MKMDEDDKKILISQITGPAAPWGDFQTIHVLQLETFPLEQLWSKNNDDQRVLAGKNYLSAIRTLTLSISA